MRTRSFMSKCCTLTTLLVAAIQVANAQAYKSYTDLHDFGSKIKYSSGSMGPDGSGPWASVSFDSVGNMYGTSASGGRYSRGLVWEITTAGNYLDLHDFGGTVTNASGSQGPDGDIPYGGVTFDGAGDMFGTALFGGPNGNGSEGVSGIVWEIANGGQYIDLHDFGGLVTNANGSGGPDGGNPCSGVTLDTEGNLYGTTSAGGPFGGGVDGSGNIWEISKSGAYRDLHDFGGTLTVANGVQIPDGCVSFAGVTFDGAGNMYGTASKAGANGSGLVWEITKLGTYIDLHDFGGDVTNTGGNQGPDGETPYGGVSLDASGNLYGTTVGGGANGQGLVWEIAEAGIYFDLHDFGGTVTIANGIKGPDGRNPYASVSFDSSGNLYGTAAYGGPNIWSGYAAGMVWEITKAGTYSDLHDFGGTVAVANGLAGPDGAHPWGGVTFDRAGNLYGPAAYGGPNGDGSGGDGSGMIWSIISCPIQSMSVSPNSLVGGAASTGTVSLNVTASWSGLSVALSSNNSNAIVPISVIVPGGSSTGTFTVVTDSVSAQTTAILTAGGSALGKTANLTINPVILTSLNLDPTSIGGGGTSTGTVTLSGPAGATGKAVSLSSSISSASVPSTVLVNAGKTSATFTITTNSVNASTVAKITATLNGTSKTASLAISPAALALVSISPSSVTGGSASTGTVTLSGSAYTGGFVVSLSSSISAALIPKTVTVPAGSSSVTFSVTTTAVTVQSFATITAKNGKVSKTAILAITPPALTSLTLTPTTVAPGGSSTGTVKITSPAPVGGLAVTLHSSSSKATAPATVKIAAGQTSAAFTIKTVKTPPAGSATFSATFGGVTESATLTIS